jgi:hypothetical protein
MPRYDYDSYLAFQDAIKSLESLNALIKRRCNAVDIKHETLKEWVVLGRFYFDSLGYVSKFSLKGIPVEMFPHFPMVMLDKDYDTFLRKYLEPCDTPPKANLHGNIPAANQTCPECGNGWTIDDCHDVIYDISGLRHHRCYQEFQIKTERAYFEKVFAEAGYLNIQLADTNNPYCTMEFCPPWFYAVVNGLHITVGNWRKRLIVIICHDPRINFNEICPDCDVTKGVDFIHAWGRDMCVTYLIMLRKIIFSE